MNNHYKKIAIIGISGSGKSTLARKLATETGLPIFHMDTIFWKGNWEEVPEEEYLGKHREIVSREKWIIEGYIDDKMADRLRQADLVIYLDYSGLRSAWQVIKRWLKHRKTSRPELPNEALERFSFKFLWLVFTRGERKNIEQALKINPPKNLKVYKNPAKSTLKDML